MQARQLEVIALSMALLLLGSAANAADFVGPESCRACHQAAYDQWKLSPHARAFRSLSPEQQKNAKCLQCHARDAAQGGDTGVTCETCHGAGQYYWPEYVMRDRELSHAAGLTMITSQDTKLCAQCHDATSPPLAPFDPVQKMHEIEHWAKQRADGSAAECPRQQHASVLPGDTFLGRALRASPAPAATRHGKATHRRRVHVAESALKASPVKAN